MYSSSSSCSPALKPVVQSGFSTSYMLFFFDMVVVRVVSAWAYVASEGSP